ncbi:glycosyltransferase family 2 protein [Falsirhodobacter halotolerans]|uniref:glycosyltransferase family 2 protein n=1 Tax=Falsirhodobacter halotolerans TaxID=1146892 RepID=UPI001FD461D0|nr:glycosyltransferase family 2 protein [Falsirhodobacter halotolerans]MCJ8138467.1 glycosyltransferase family 2 protein [Falsirhodobacter halotolerans]
MTWGICTTAKAPPKALRAFVGHHLSLGADHIWLHLDDPDDPFALSHPRVTVQRCDARWWGARRPDRHQNRQARNMQRLYAQAPLPWIAHLDVDEFLHPLRPVGEVLAETATPLLPLRPWEALEGGREFRAPLRRRWLMRRIAFGPHAQTLQRGALSHHIGKSFFRTGVPGMEPRLHGGFLNGARIKGIPFAPDLPLLHFHADDRSAWQGRLPFRLARGAYGGNAALVAVLSDPARVAPFYDAVQNPSGWRRRILRACGLLMTVDLDLARHEKDIP